MKVVKELKNLQNLLDIYDQIICDNGYRLRDGHPSLKMPKQAPACNDQDGQVTPLAAGHKRGCMAIRNGHERINGWLKRYKFCRTKIRSDDISKIPDVWSIVAADMVRYRVEITKDDDNSTLLTEKILDMLHIAVNPMDIYWTDTKFKNNNQIKKITKEKAINNLKKDCVKKIGNVEYCRICDQKYPNGTKWTEHKQSKQHSSRREKIINSKSSQNDSNNNKKRNSDNNKSQQSTENLKCTFCGGGNVKFRCSGCKDNPQIPYCSNKCRDDHWKIHKKVCKGKNSNHNKRKRDSEDEYEEEQLHSLKRRKLMTQTNDDEIMRDSESSDHGDNNIESEHETDTDNPSTDDDYASSIGSFSIDSYYDDSDNIESEHETDTDCSDDSHHEGMDDEVVHDDDDDVDDSSNWEVVATGWDQILKYIKSNDNQLWKNIFGTKQDPLVRKCDVDNYLGKDWEWRRAMGYIKKLEFNQSDLSLLIHKSNPYITKWMNVKSKFRSSKKYNVILGFYEIFLFNQSQLKLFYEEMNDDVEANKIIIKDDEMHWYNWLKHGNHDVSNQKHPVSYYLSEKYNKIQKTLEARRVERMKRSRQYYYGCINVGVMNKEDLLYFAKEHQVDIPKHITKKKSIRDHVLSELRKRYQKEWENSQTCFDNKCNKKATKRCSQCKGAYYCSQKCNENNWDQHKLKCNELYAAQHKQSVASQMTLFDSLESIEELREDAVVPASLAYLNQYPKMKSWYDKNFKLDNSSLSRLQQRCNCRSGVQLPGVCAHIGAVIRLTYFILFRDVNELLKMNKRDRLINENIVNLTPFSKEQRRLREENVNKHWCPICGTPTIQNCVQCDGCQRWYHPECIKTTLDDIAKDHFTATVFHCPMCSNHDVWVVRNT